MFQRSNFYIPRILIIYYVDIFLRIIYFLKAKFSIFKESFILVEIKNNIFIIRNQNFLYTFKGYQVLFLKKFVQISLKWLDNSCYINIKIFLKLAIIWYFFQYIPIVSQLVS